MKSQKLINIILFTISIGTLIYSLYMNHHWEVWLNNPMINWHTYYMEEFQRLTNNQKMLYNDVNQLYKSMGFETGPDAIISTPSSQPSFTGK